MVTNPYEKFVSGLAKLVAEGARYPLGGFALAPRPQLARNAPKVLVFSPHPDDECIVGALPLRLQREAGMSVSNVAVTLGSNEARRAERRRELEGACGYLGFGLTIASGEGLENITVALRESDKKGWARAVEIVGKIMLDEKPAVVFTPHEKDWHPTHIGTHLLVMDALKSAGKGAECLVVETEFWGAMEAPNLMVESRVEDVTDLVTALSFHAGEVRRNPFHLRLPAWMQDNVRRGSELVQGKGEAAPDYAFATLYRLRQWREGRLQNVFEGGRFMTSSQIPTELFDKRG